MQNKTKDFFSFYLFIYLFLAVLGLVAAGGLFSLLAAILCSSAQASHCSGFSCCRAQVLGAQA